VRGIALLSARALGRQQPGAQLLCAEERNEAPSKSQESLAEAGLAHGSTRIGGQAEPGPQRCAGRRVIAVRIDCGTTPVEQFRRAAVRPSRPGDILSLKSGPRSKCRRCAATPCVENSDAGTKGNFTLRLEQACCARWFRVGARRRSFPLATQSRSATHARCAGKNELAVHPAADRRAAAWAAQNGGCFNGSLACAGSREEIERTSVG